MDNWGKMGALGVWDHPKLKRSEDGAVKCKRISGPSNKENCFILGKQTEKLPDFSSVKAGSLRREGKTYQQDLIILELTLSS